MSAIVRSAEVSTWFGRLETRVEEGGEEEGECEPDRVEGVEELLERARTLRDATLCVDEGHGGPFLTWRCEMEETRRAAPPPRPPTCHPCRLLQPFQRPPRARPYSHPPPHDRQRMPLCGVPAFPTSSNLDNFGRTLSGNGGGKGGKDGRPVRYPPMPPIKSRSIAHLLLRLPSSCRERFAPSLCICEELKLMQMD